MRLLGPPEDPGPSRLGGIVLAVIGVALLRAIFGPFRLQGVLFVVVTAVVAWTIGPRTGLLSALLGIAASHVMRFIAAPASIFDPAVYASRQYLTGLAAYTVLSAIALLIGRWHRMTAEQLEATRAARDLDDLAHRAERETLQHRLVALTEASGALLRSPRVDDVVAAMLQVARDLLPADGYAVWRREPTSGRWHIQASEGIGATFAQATLPDTANAQFTELLAMTDVAAASMVEHRRIAYDAEGIRSMLIVPVVTNGVTTSTVVFYYRTRQEFSEPERLAAKAFGHLASAALTTAELYDAQQRSRVESEFVADAGVLLANSPDYRQTLAQVARLAVPFFADLCVVDLVDGAGSITRLTAEDVDPRRGELVRGGDSPGNPPPVGVARAIRAGIPILLEQVTDEPVAADAHDTEYRGAFEGLGIASAMIVPMMARERGVGAFIFALGPGPRRYSSDDLRFATLIASRAALAIESAEAYEQATRASRLKDEFLATLSHELRTPLNAVVGYARMASSGMLQGERLARALSTLERNASSLTRLVEDVLDVSRFMTGKVQLKLQEIDLSTVVDQAVVSMRPAADAKAVALTWEPAPGIAVVQGDPDRLQQVAWNILSNAVKFTPRGGAVHVEMAACGRTVVEIVVRDTGAGITPEFLPHVFDRFRQGDGRLVREHGGLGLGLAIARDLVELHGGTIDASSGGPGQGAEFRVRLPLVMPVEGVLGNLAT
jgi:signal transduction histidine kinase